MINLATISLLFPLVGSSIAGPPDYRPLSVETNVVQSAALWHVFAATDEKPQTRPLLQTPLFRKQQSASPSVANPTHGTPVRRQLSCLRE